MCISLISLLGGMFTIHIQINNSWITKWNQDGYHRQVTNQHYTGVKYIFSFTNAGGMKLEGEKKSEFC